MSHLPITPPEPAPANEVKRAIANALLGVPPAPMLGSVTLLPHQIDAVARLTVILERHHIALLADDVGLGKTFVALAVAQRYAHVHIIAPAALLPMWQSAMTRARCTHAALVSLQRYSREATPRTAGSEHTLIVIDEAHHLRNANTARYRAVGREVAGHDVLLLSATPLHNRPSDLRNLFALTLGHADARLNEERLAALIVRRTRTDHRPRVEHRAPHHVPHDPAVLEAILALPAPLPAHDGAVAGALIKLGLLRAWCSSDAALAQSLTKRLLRGEALRQALLAGRHPTQQELRGWLVGEQEVQLAFPELLATHATETAPLIEVLTRHLDAVAALRSLQRQRGDHDRARVAALRAVLREHGTTPVVAFSQFAETVRAVGRALGDIAGVGVLTGRRATIASGSISRLDALYAFAPRAHGRPPPPPHQRIHLLLTTDLLAEGVNLQDAGVVVHLDLPWTDALRQQRVGRCVRVGSPHDLVVVHELAPPHSVDALLRLNRRLQRKAHFAQRFVGAVASVSPAPTAGAARASPDGPLRASAADAATWLREELEQWRASPSADSRDAAMTDASRQVLLVALHTQRAGFLALVERPDGTATLVAGRRRASGAPARVLAIARDAREARALAHVPLRAWTRTRRALRRWCRRTELRAAVGAEERGAARDRTRARALAQHAALSCGATDRARLRVAWLAADEMLRRVRGVAADNAIKTWIDQQPAMRASDWLSHWRTWPALTDVPPPLRDGMETAARRARVLAVLVCTSSH